MSKNQKTILMVEDEDEIAANMDAMLTLKGYRILRATDAGGAITIAEQDRPTIILTDLDLPTLDSLMQRVRAHETLNNLPVAVLDTNHPEPKDDLKILKSFDELEELLASAPAS